MRKHWRKSTLDMFNCHHQNKLTDTTCRCLKSEAIISWTAILRYQYSYMISLIICYNTATWKIIWTFQSVFKDANMLLVRYLVVIQNGKLNDTMAIPAWNNYCWNNREKWVTVNKIFIGSLAYEDRRTFMTVRILEYLLRI